MVIRCRCGISKNRAPHTTFPSVRRRVPELVYGARSVSRDLECAEVRRLPGLSRHVSREKIIAVRFLFVTRRCRTRASASSFCQRYYYFVASRTEERRTATRGTIGFLQAPFNSVHVRLAADLPAQLSASNRPLDSLIDTQSSPRRYVRLGDNPILYRTRDNTISFCNSYLNLCTSRPGRVTTVARL